MQLCPATLRSFHSGFVPRENINLFIHIFLALIAANQFQTGSGQPKLTVTYVDKQLPGVVTRMVYEAMKAGA